MSAANHVVALNLGFAITVPETANEFTINGNHLTLIKGNQFDGRTKTNPHKHIHQFLIICEMFKYRDTNNEAVLLMMFPLSLTGEAKTWLDEHDEGTIETWDELRTAFISRFFPPAFFDRLLREIRAFSQHEKESLTDAWHRMKEMPRNCHGHNLSKGNIIKIFYHGLNEITQKVLNAATGEEDFNALLDEGSEILHSIEGTILEETLFAKFNDFIAMTTDENSKFKSDTEEPPFQKITFNIDYKIKTSFEEPHMDLELKPLPDNLEYVFLEEPSFLVVIISSQLLKENKYKLVSILKRHKQAFAWKTTYILRICQSFCKNKFQLLEDKNQLFKNKDD
nr:reverse transcriptase domain-containing protein [Tanacetum cinerariifolium]